jgi:divalent metal cation (Fe/Co/Zn/Cd) transporter
MRLSLFIGMAVLAVKITAYVLSHSQALLADVAESVVHQVAVGLATYLAYLQLQPTEIIRTGTASSGLYQADLRVV